MLKTKTQFLMLRYFTPDFRKNHRAFILDGCSRGSFSCCFPLILFPSGNTQNYLHYLQH